MPFELPSDDQPAVVVHGDCRERMAELADASVHVVLTDPPSGLGFMGASWDSFKGYVARTALGRAVDLQLGCADLLRRCRTALAGVCTSEAEQLVRELDEALGVGVEMPAWARGFVVFLVDVWSECKRVLKPGGLLCAWGLPRTSDLLGLSLRLAGLEVKESVLHLFGGGKPAGLDIGRALARAQRVEAAQLDGCHTHLAPGHEVWVVARKPLAGETVASAAVRHSTAALNIGACLVPRRARPKRVRAATSAGGIYGDFAERGSAAAGETDDGSFANDVVLSHAPGCTDLACVSRCPAKLIDQQSGILTSGVGSKRKASAGKRGHVYGRCTAEVGAEQHCIGDTGGASRYFTSFRVEPRARGLARALAAARASLPARVFYKGKRPDRTLPGFDKRKRRNDHPTVKTQALMRWLVRLLATRPSGEPLLVLDPFGGSGSTAIACIAEGARCIAFELDARHAATARERIAAAVGDVEGARLARANRAEPHQLALC